jgi:photosystem II stability/assembly factor-like uncharacterized protein
MTASLRLARRFLPVPAIAPLLRPDRPLAAMAPRATRQACAGVDRGPCASPDALRFLPGAEPVALTNFGLLYRAPAGEKWEVVCDDNYALAPATRMRRAPDGRLFAPSDEGLYRTADGCTFQASAGAVAGKIVFDVAFDARSPQRIWALGDLPRKLWISSDSGQTFSQQQAFGDTFTVSRLVSAPSDPQHLYIFGRGAQGTSPSGQSLDGGLTVTIFDLSAGATPRPPTPLEFLAISPVDPLTLYFVSVDGNGDELWKSNDGGKTVRRLLKLEGLEALGGFAFGATPETIYVGGASTDIVPVPGQPPARLYISRDGGATWQPQVPSSAQGPRYTCLSASGDALYACTPGELLGEAFMVGVSRDEGKTWSPLVKLESLGSARSCVKAQCLRTEQWLCESYQQCREGLEPRLDAGEEPTEDGGVDARDAPVDAITPPPRRSSSGCSVAGATASPRPAAAGLLLSLSLSLLLVRLVRRGVRRQDQA